MRTTLALLLLAAGCASPPSAAFETPRPCTDDGQCDSGQICFENGCGSTVDFSARVTPLNGSGYVVQDYAWVGVGRSNSVDLSLWPPAIIEGALKIKRASTTAEYLAGPFTVVARGTSIIPGLGFDQPVTQTVREGATFSFAVPPGTWHISASAADLELPPVYSERSVSSGEIVDPGLIMPGDNLLVVEGQLLVSASKPWPLPAPSFRFQVLDTANRTALSQAPTFAGGDAFRVTALDSSKPVTLKVTPVGEAARLVPSKEFASDSAQRFPKGFEMGLFGTPVAVTGKVQDSHGNPIPDAEVELRGTVRGGGTFAASARSDLDGAYQAELLPSDDAPGLTATYLITARPPQQSLFASASVRSAVAVDGAALPALVCPPKHVLSGQILSSGTSTSGPLAGVLVQYEGNKDAADPGLSKGDVQTDSAGRYRVLVEPGAYRVVAKPATDKRLPWAARRVSVSADTTLNITLSRPREVLGTVKAKNADGTSTPVPNAVVAIYRAQSSITPAPPPLLVYEALSDAVGQFKLVLPDAGGN